MSLPQSVRHFIDSHQWRASEFEVHQAADSTEFTDEILSKDYAVPVYVVRNWAVAHFTERVVYMDLKEYVFDGDVSLDNEEKYLVCGLFQEPVSLMHRYIKSGKTVTLSFRYELEDSNILTRKSVKHKELEDSNVKFLVDVTKRRCRVFAFLKRGRNGEKPDGSERSGKGSAISSNRGKGSNSTRDRSRYSQKRN